jgi:cholesterol oxidase
MADVDVLVIGSGFGGATAAARLTEAGLRVTVVERGPWRDTVPVRSMGIEERAPLPYGRRFASHVLRTLRSPWLRGGVTLNRKGLFELYVGKGLNVACASSVGGGSHAYGGLNMRPAVEGYWNGHTADISEQTMEPHYQSLFESMDSHAPRRDERVPNTTAERFGDSPVLESGWDTVDVAMGFLFPPVARCPQPFVTTDGVTRHEADMRDGGFLGSTTGAKTTLDFALFAGAMKKGLAVEALCEVKAIERLASGSPSRYRVEAIDHRVGRRRDFLADHVLLAAGTLNTLRLLLHSRSIGKLTGMPRLGYRFGGNGDFLGYWNLDDRTRDLTRGMPVHGFLRMKEPDPLGAGRAWPMIADAAAPSPEGMPLPMWLKRKMVHGSLIVGMGPDTQDGVVRWRHGRMRIEYDPSRSAIFRDLIDAYAKISAATGKRILHFQRPLTVHPTGGACFGQTVGSGVVDSNGEVFGVDGLFVADAAALPGPVGGPPAMTVAAWAEHVADRFIERSTRSA